MILGGEIIIDRYLDCFESDQESEEELLYNFFCGDLELFKKYEEEK